MAFIKKNWLIIVLVVVVLGAGYYFVFANNPGNDGSSAVSVEDGPSSAAEATFLNLSSQLEPIHFDTSVLSDPRFTSLQDIHTAIVPEAQGRTDPFGPISGVSADK